MKSSIWIVGALLLGLMQGGALGQIRIGQTVGVTGSVAGSVKDLNIGAKLIIDDTNARGGVKGQRVDLITIDDGFDVKRSTANAETLITKEKVIAMFLNRGTPHAQAMVPLLAKHGVPLIAPSTGADALHEPPIREVFNLRSKYQEEAVRSIIQLARMGVAVGPDGRCNIGLVHVDDSFGKDAAIGAMRGFQKINCKPLFVIGYDRVKEDLREAVAAATRPNADGYYPAVLLVGSPSAVSTAIKQVRKAGSKAYMATLSSNASSGFIKALGDDAAFVMVSQVFPKESDLAIPLVRETSELLKKAHPGVPLTPAMLEGASAAKLLISALRKSGPPFTSKRLIEALESGAPMDIGWPEQTVAFSPTNRTGVNYVDLAIIGSTGKFRR